MQVPFFLPSGYGVAEGNGAKAPSPMKGLLSGAKRQPRSITRRFEEKRCCPTRFVENRWATHATNKVPVYAGTFLFTFGVWSCRRQRGESPKPHEKVVNKLFFLCVGFFVLSCGCGKFVKLLFCRVAVVQTCPKRNGKFFAYFGTTHIQALFLDCFEDALCFQNKCKRRSFFRRQQTKIVKHTM